MCHWFHHVIVVMVIKVVITIGKIMNLYFYEFVFEQ